MKVAAIDRRAVPAGATFSSWAAPDGWPIRRLDWEQRSGAAARGSLIFAGGRGDFIEKYLEPLGHWHSAGWNATSFDWRSQGGSRGDSTGGHLDSFDPLLADGAALIAQWMQEAEGPHVALGHSMGGHLLLRIIAEHKPKLAAAALIAPMIGINATPVPTAVGRATARILSILGWSKVPAWKHNERPAPPGSTRQSYLTSCGNRYSDELWWHGQQPGYRLGPPTWGWLNAAYRSIGALSAERLRGIDLPILLIGTDRDRLVSPTAIRRVAGLLPRSELLMFLNAAHEILREADPVRLEALARIDRFFEEHASA
jgi:lysophospholipase